MTGSDQVDATEAFDSHGPQADGSARRDPAPGLVNLPSQIGRYRIEKVLGHGGFGLVYLAQDEQLQRPVAIKVPHAQLISCPQDAEAYLAEARTVANLDHPGIVPVYDVGAAADFPCYVVSKYIAGIDLATRIKKRRLSSTAAAELVATVAEALHYAHKQGLVHRDVKPGNILIGADGKPYVVDFGLALREDKLGQGPKYAGTPAYMSPEQARGEGHRVDGRSDIFSLGVVFYELLAGRPPFRGDTQAELLERVTSYEPRPLLQYDEQLPKELQRICFKALSKRAADRYCSAYEMAEDVRHFLAAQTINHDGRTPGGVSSVTEPRAAAPAATSGGSRAESAAATGPGGLSDSQPLRIVPKGLRSFDAHDADFFLELLPGPRDREGLPDSLRFWKTRIEETDPENTFSVGLIYGPSGCGKSSLVKAGLLPRLSENVIAVYIEATPDETEARLLHGLRKRCPTLDEQLSLRESLTALRRGQGVPVGTKVLIVLDQFEQWLHASKEKDNNDLVAALRQCDGGRVQCIVMVRDDFWLSATRFMGELEVDLLQGRNTMLADLFDPGHARTVLAAFGRAFGQLPESAKVVTRDQNDFLKQAIGGLVEDGKVICVRLALFAEMMKGRPWTSDTLQEVGGTKGVGVTFLEETFSAATAHPTHRLHQNAARAVLQSLLPESGADIKGDMKSYEELLEASGYAGRPRDFDNLMRILDSEIRLITPTDPEGAPSDDQGLSRAAAGQKYYQLTHDYLVRSLRDWLTRKQRETRRGRAQLRLAERSALWSSKPENRHLPSLWEWAGIRRWTDKTTWNQAQRTMMVQAARVHGLRCGILSAALAAVVLLAIGGYYESQATRLTAALLDASADRVTELRQQLPVVAWRADAKLLPYARQTDDRTRALHAQIGLVRRHAEFGEPLRQALLDDAWPLEYLAVIGDALKDAGVDFTEQLGEVLRNASQPEAVRFRAGLVLSKYAAAATASDAAPWQAAEASFLVQQYLTANPEFHAVIRRYLAPNRQLLQEPLVQVCGELQRVKAEQVAAAKAIAEFYSTDYDCLFPLLLSGAADQFLTLFPLVKDTHALEQQLLAKVREQPTEQLGTLGRLALGQQRAGAAITLLRQGGSRRAVLDTLRVQDDPEAMTQFIHRCRARGVTVQDLLELWALSPQLAERSAMTAEARRSQDSQLFGVLLSLGEYSWSQVPADRQAGLREQVADLFRDDKSSGVHAAAGWLLRTWGQENPELAKLAEQINERKVPRREGWEWYTEVLEVEQVGALLLTTVEKFYQTYVLFEARDYRFGSPSDEPDREADEVPHTRRLAGFAVLDRELTRGEVEASKLFTFSGYESISTTPAHAMGGPNWYDAVRVSRWLSDQLGYGESQAYRAESDLPEWEYERDKADRLGGVYNWPVDPLAGGFRLPTEHEWEASCRGGMRTKYGFGSAPELLPSYGWFQENNSQQAHPPGQLRPNLRGLFDVHGNVYEWCHDWFGRYAAEGEATEPSEGSRVVRGGGLINAPRHCRSANRGWFAPSLRDPDFGFRVVRSSLRPSQE